MKQKTIGPMTLDDGDWVAPSSAWLCSEVLRERFNIPNTATKLWVTATKHRPRHGDAIRVRLDSWGYARLDDTKEADVYMPWGMREAANDFGEDFYATIYYA